VSVVKDGAAFSNEAGEYADRPRDEQQADDDEHDRDQPVAEPFDGRYKGWQLGLSSSTYTFTVEFFDTIVSLAGSVYFTPQWSGTVVTISTGLRPFDRIA
jgi:hypothetical protein